MLYRLMLQSVYVHKNLMTLSIHIAAMNKSETFWPQKSLSVANCIVKRLTPVHCCCPSVLYQSSLINLCVHIICSWSCYRCLSAHEWHHRGSSLLYHVANFHELNKFCCFFYNHQHGFNAVWISQFMVAYGQWCLHSKWKVRTWIIVCPVG